MRRLEARIVHHGVVYGRRRMFRVGSRFGDALNALILRGQIHRQLRAIADAQASLASRLDRVEERIQRLGRKVGPTTDPRTAPISSSASQHQGSAEGSSSGQPRSSTGHVKGHPKPHDRPRGHRHGLHGGSSLSTLHELQHDSASAPRRTSRHPQSSGNRFY